MLPTTEAPTIWVTRTAPYNRLTARHLKGAGFRPLLEPALHVLPLPVTEPIAVPDALVFTSLQAIRLHRFFPSLAEIPVFAVGDHSARFARLRGYRNVASASGDVHDLRGLVRARMRTGADILHISAVQPAADLAAMLREDGFIARRLCVYETVEASLLDLEWIAGSLASIDIILIHSPRAARHVAAWLHRQSPDWAGVICCISAAAAAPFEGVARARIRIAARPDEASLLSLLLPGAGGEERKAMAGG